MSTIQYLLFYEPEEEYGWASNFYSAKPLLIEGETWQNTEQYFQAMKFRETDQKGYEYSNIIKEADTPMKVKCLGTQKKHHYGKSWKINKKTDQRLLFDILDEYKNITIRTDWEAVKINVMIKALIAKFQQKDLCAKITSIPDNALLVEHTTRDNVWADGGDKGTEEKGSNYLGKILTVLSHVLKYGNCNKMNSSLKKAVKINKVPKILSKDTNTLKILSWNINGMRSNILSAGKYKCSTNETKIDPSSNLGSIISDHDPDIICMQETRCGEEIAQCVKIQGYYQYWNSSKGEGARSGDRYSGVTLWSKKEPLSVSTSLPNFEDNEGRIILAEFEDFILLVTYVPNAGTNFEYRTQVWDPAILEFLQKNKKKLVWCGDLNVARTPNDVFWGDPKSSSYDPAALKGVGKAAKAGYTKEERKDMEQFLEAGYVDVYRYLYPEEKGAYTWFNPRIPTFRESNKGWRIDYFVVSKNLVSNIQDMQILRESGLLTKPQGSDHTAILLKLNFNI